jgi:hypothetical protein
MALDLTSWLISIGIAKEKAEALAPDLKPAEAAIEQGVLRQDDYSRKMGEITKLQEKLDDNNRKLNEDIAEFAAMSVADQEAATELRNRIELAEDKAFKLTQKITRYAEQNGIDVKTVIGDVEPAKEPVKPSAAVFDDAKLRGEFNNAIGGVASYMLDLQAALPDIAREHEELTGEKFDQRGFIAAIKADIAAKKTGNLDPFKRWEAAYGIVEKRTARATANREADLKKAREEGRLEGLSQAALPGGQQGGNTEHHSPVFQTKNVTQGSILKREQPSTRLHGAISALQTGKYRKTA